MFKAGSASGEDPKVSTWLSKFRVRVEMPFFNKCNPSRTMYCKFSRRFSTSRGSGEQLDSGNTSLLQTYIEYWLSCSTILKISHWICHISMLKDSLIERIYIIVPPQNLRACNLHITPTHRVHYCYCNCIDRRNVSIYPASSQHYSLGYWNFFARSLIFLMSFTMENH